MGEPDQDMMTGRLIGLAIKVHRAVGPGCLEQIYGDCLAFEFERAGVRFRREVEIGLSYEGVRLPRAYKADFLVDDSVVLEIKSVEQLLPVHKSQLLTYVRLSGCRVGLLMNFNVSLLRQGLVRVVV